jgi:predicted Zn-dependent protease
MNAVQASPELTNAFRLLQQGKTADAETACREMLSRAPQDAGAMHLFALVRKAAGDITGSERLMRASIELAPYQSDFRSNLAGLMRMTGRLREAEALYREALARDPDHHDARMGLSRTLGDLSQPAAAEGEARVLVAQRPADPFAWSALASSLRAQSRMPEAEMAYRQALNTDPDHVIARADLASLLLDTDRPEDALEVLETSAPPPGKSFPYELARGRALAQLYRIEESEAAFAAAVALEPRHAQAQFYLARIRHMLGDSNFAREIGNAIKTHREDMNLQMLLVEVLRRVGDLPAAEALLRDILTRSGPLPEMRATLAGVLHEANKLKEAEKEALDAAAALPRDPFVIDQLVAILLARGRPVDALPFVYAQRQRAPLDQGWIAYEATCARLMNHAHYAELYNYDKFLRTYMLAPPSGWQSMEQLNAALLETLNARLKFGAHLFDQSLRNGCQTTRNLVTERDPAIRAIMQAFQVAIQSYIEEMVGFAKELPGADKHPFLSRLQNRAHMKGAWAVQLRRDGFHMNHFHAGSWISSAYYVGVPSESADENLKSGWLKFGEPRFATPGATPERVVQPKPGLLALFPAYFWHGTKPIHGIETRTAISFDVLPGAAV